MHIQHKSIKFLDQLVDASVIKPVWGKITAINYTS